jgi:hypothetical protein
MVEGFACHARGVETVTSTAHRFQARVRSKRMHDVCLRAERGRLVIACSCPARSLGLDGCKHAWASLLEIDRLAAFQDLRQSPGALVVEMVAPDVKSKDQGPEDKSAKPKEEPKRPGVAKAAASNRAGSPKSGAKAPPAPEKPAPTRKKKRSRS